MADEKEQILLEIKIDKPQTEADIDKLTASIEGLKQSNSELAKQQIELTKAGKANTAEYVENAKQIELNKHEISKNGAERKNLITMIKAEENSYEAISARMSKNKSELKGLNTATAEGKKRVDELTKSIHADNVALTDADKKQGSFLRNVGNYPQALNAVTGGMYSTAQGTAGLGKQLWLLVANPIGAILAALAAVLILITSYFKNSGDGADAFDKKMKQVSAIVDVAIDRISKLVRALIAFATGDWQKGVEEATAAFGGLGDELEREVAAAGLLAELLDKIGDSEREYAVAASETTNEIKRLIMEAKNRSLTEQERQTLLNKALDLEREKVQQLNEIRTNALRAAVLEAQQRADTQQGVNESLEEYAKRLMRIDKLTDDLRDGIKDALVSQQDAVGESLTLQEKIQNQIVALQEKQEAENEKRSEKELKRRQEEFQKHIDQLREKYVMELEEQAAGDAASEELRAMEGEATAEQRQANFEKELEQLAEKHRVEFEMEQTLINDKMGLLSDYDALHEDTIEKRREREKKAADYEKMIDRLKNDAIAGGIELITKEKSDARVALNVIFKADAIKETVVNGYNAAVAAYKSLAGIPIIGPVLGAAAAGLVAVFTAGQVAKIAGIQFAKGGKAATTGGRSHSEGGTKYYGEDGHVVELERGENWYVLNRGASREINSLSAMNVRHGGVDFSNRGWHRALGGQVETRQAANTSSGQINVAQVVSEVLGNANIVVTVEDINAGIDRNAEITNKAQVI